MDIKLTQGYVTLIDNEDHERMKTISWRVFKRPNKRTMYARGWIKINGKFKSILMHRFIMNLRSGDNKQVDHINGNGLDNRKGNLRICNNKQNAQNRGKRINCVSKFKGVARVSNSNKWQAQIWHNGKKIYLGVFSKEEDAAKAYDIEANKLFGEYSNINFLED
ncbi:MAG: HNH endonuclease [Candidatus Heimdallarchaeota archaeon]|nr:HNH endonuclease [Candidatus Heimdallarchaeota archaeon]